MRFTERRCTFKKKESERACKPGFVLLGVNFPKEAIISLRWQLPATSSSPPEKKPKRNASGRRLERTLFCSALLPMGFTKPDQSPGLLVSSYLTVSPLPTDKSLLAVYFLWHFP